MSEQNDAVAGSSRFENCSIVPGLVPEEGKGCWRRCRARRAAFLIDGRSYFAALRESLLRARRSILVVGWDIDSKVELVRDGDPSGPIRLRDVLDEVTDRNPEIEVHILVWDFSMVYLLDRELLPVFQFGLKTGPRIHFAMDKEHPLSGSHHQKVVVIDDRVAYAGGIDLTRNRWDTSAHVPEDPRRTNPRGQSYTPFHDVQILVEGPPAAALGDLLRERWRRARRQTLDPPGEIDSDPWPPSLNPEVTDVDVAVSRTEPQFKGNPDVREVARLYEEQIAAARRSLYVENQYLTAGNVVQALAQRLREKDGPEVVIVLPRESSGWLAQQSMDLIRNRALGALKDADSSGRLRVFFPEIVRDAERIPVFVHSKVLVVDDLAARVGSSNLNNRSMGLDTEVDLTVVAGSDEHRSAIRGFLARLIGDHLGRDPEEVKTVLEETGALIPTIERLAGSSHTLTPLEEECGPWEPCDVPEETVLDPEQPVELDRIVETLGEADDHPETTRVSLWIKTGILVFLVVGLLVVGQFTPLGDLMTRENLTDMAHTVEGWTLGPLVAVLGFAVAAVGFIPVTLLVGVTTGVFDFFPGALYALLGSLLACALSYGLGKALGRDPVRKMGGARLNRLSRRLARKGWLAVAVIRMLPVAPFWLVNLVAGASHVKLRDFLLGSAVGMAPGILGLGIIIDRAKRSLIEPNLVNIGVLVVVLILLVSASAWWSRRLLRHE